MSWYFIVSYVKIFLKEHVGVSKANVVTEGTKFRDSKIDTNMPT